jgi:hypothetical protein
MPAIPELASTRYNRIVPAKRLAEGVVYRFCIKGMRGLSPAWPMLVLVDSDENGVIDGHLLLSGQQWEQGGWDDPATYESLWME